MDNTKTGWKNKRHELQQIQAELAIHILQSRIDKIRYVHDWAKETGYSTSKLCGLIKKYHKQNAKEVLRRVRYERVLKLLKNNPQITSYSVAVDCGLSNEHSLFKFLNRNFNTTYSELKSEVLLKRLKKSKSKSKMGRVL